MYLTRTSFFERYSAKSSAILLVNVVTKTRSEFLHLLFISEIKLSIWSLVGLISICGSSKPVGRTNCSTIFADIFFS